MSLWYFMSKLIKKLHIPAIKNSNIDKTARVCSGSLVVNVILGKYSYIGDFCTIVNTQIGNFCSIAGNCIIGGARHPVEWVSTSPVFHKGKNILKKNFSLHEYKIGEETIIGNDVWIGNNCLIKSGIKIGNGAIIGMGSVLTKDVEEYEIWGGNPARLIRKRFDEELIKIIGKINWWEFNDERIERLALFFTDTERFVKAVRVEEPE